MRVSRYHSDVVSRFTFDELCATELGSSDYQAIANHFRVVMIENIPRLTLSSPDKARRFITLIDELYEAGCCLACTAADIPDRLFVGKAVDDDRSDDDDDGDDGNFDLSNNSTEDDVGAKTSAHTILAVDVAQASGYSVGQLASLKELSFAFGRAASRLLEMCSKTWWHERSALPRG
jgi:predicted ATPase